MKSVLSKAVPVVSFIIGFAGVMLSQNSVPAGQGMVQRVKIHGKALEGNLLGETADPDVLDQQRY